MRAGEVTFAVILAMAAAVGCVPAVAKPAKVVRELSACTSYAGWRHYRHAPPKDDDTPPKACPKTIPQGEVVEVIDPDAGEGSATIQWRGKAWYVDADSFHS
jgi:hypothetical protein